MNHDSEKSIEQLLKLAGEREMPSAEGIERARSAALESWQRTLRPSRRWFTIVVGVALAASAVAIVAWLPGRFAPSQAVARVVTFEGDAILHDGSRENSLSAGATVMTRDSVETAEGGVALTLANSVSLRMHSHTHLRFDSPSSLTLLAGEIYVDSGGINAMAALNIATPEGTARHVGTQFQVSVAGTATRVRVREGRVIFTPLEGGSARDVAAGEQLLIAAGHTTLTRGLPAFGADWEWAAAVAPAFDIEGRPLSEFLAWAAREHGWQLRHSSAALQQRTYEIRLHGALDQSSTDAMIGRISLITGVPLAVRNGVLWVGETG